MPDRVAISIIVIPLLATAFHGTIGSAIIALSAGPLFGVTVPSDWVAFTLLTLLSIFALGPLAALIGVVSTSARATVLWSQLVFLPSMLIGGLMLDLERLCRAGGVAARSSSNGEPTVCSWTMRPSCTLNG